MPVSRLVRIFIAIKLATFAGVFCCDAIAAQTALDTKKYTSLIIGEEVQFPQPQTSDAAWTKTYSFGGSQSAKRTNRPISVQISGKFSDFTGATLLVYDAEGFLVEDIELEELENDTIFTKFSPGNHVTLEIRSDRALAGKLTIDRLVTPAIGNSDAATGALKLELDEAVDVDPTLFAATARLIVGRNAFPLGGDEPIVDPDWCTGVLVAQDLLATANHCLAGNFCSQTVALFGYSVRVEDEASARKCIEVVYRNRALDFAVLRLTPIDKKIVVGHLAGYSPEENAPLVIVQHPYGAVRLISREACNVTGKIVNLGHFVLGVTSDNVQNLGFGHSCDTLNGSSGSPVFDETGAIVGIHQGEYKGLNRAVSSARILDCIMIDENSQSVAMRPNAHALCDGNK